MEYAKPSEKVEFDIKPNVTFLRSETRFKEVSTQPQTIADSKSWIGSKWMRLARYGLEFVLINSAFALAYFSRFNLQLGSEVDLHYQIPLSEYLGIQLGYTAILLIALHLKGFYRMSRTAGFLDELGKIISASTVSFAILLVTIFIMRPLDVSRLMFIYLLPLTILVLAMERLTVRRVYRVLWMKGIGVSNTLVVGATDVGMRLINSLMERPTTGYRLVGYVDDEERFSKWTMRARFPKRDANQNSQIEMLGPTSALGDLITRMKVKQVFIALPSQKHEIIDSVIRQCYEMNVGFTLVPDIFELKVNALKVEELNGIPLISYKENHLSGWNYVMKRVMDIMLAIFGLLVAAIPMLIIAIAVKLDSKGPVLFRQTRVGKNGKTFTFLKFRSMYVNAEQMLENLRQYNQTGGVTFKMENDPRRTRVGRFIRRTSLDELPQLFNILFGQMSFVGPRPPIVNEVERYDDWHYRRLEVTPGLTGLWQVSGRSNISFEDMIKLDIYYSEHWSLWLDFKILAKTLPAVLKGDGAY